MTSTRLAPAEAATPAVDGARAPHHPGLDGVRGAAVAAVLLFHGGFGWARGGYLGVSTFFTLSGFLITGLLVQERARAGRIALPRFWDRRFRRLLPALLVCVLGIALYAETVAHADQLERLRGDALATLGYVANWRFVLTGQAYADLFASPSPLLHTWSLAIEEQFYVVFPLLVAVVLALGGGRRRVLGAVLAVLSLGSVAASLALGDDHTRVYYGTDTRAAELLLGGLLAVWAAAPGRDLHTRRRPVVAAAGCLALAASVSAWVVVGQERDWLYRGGLAGYGLVSVAVVAAAVSPGPVRWLLSLRPLRVLGLVSYGVYLYHWPIFLWLSPERTELGRAPLFGLRLVLTFGVATVSYLVVEQPVRRGALRGWRAPTLGAAVAAGAVIAVLATTVAPGAPGRLSAGATVPAPSTATLLWPKGRAATPAAPLRVLMVGDSVAYDAAPGIVAALHATGAATVVTDTVLGFGISLPEGSPGADWRERWPRLVEEVRPELVITLWGSWDEGFVAEKGQGAYGRILDEAVRILAADGARILAMGMPVTKPRDSDVPWPRPSREGFRRLATRHPGRVAFFDTDPVISPGGQFVSHLPGPGGRERVRKLDGTHFCPAGAARLGEGVLVAVRPTWSLPAPNPLWRAGAWALEPRFDSPPGACP